MKFRRDLFRALAILSVLFMACGLFYTANVTSNTINTATLTPDSLDPKTARAAYNVGAFIGASMFSSIFGCIGFAGLIVFGLLSWRNSVGLKAEQRHAETIEVMRNQSL